MNNYSGGFLTVSLNPVIQKTIVLDTIVEGQANRSSKSRTDTAGKGLNVARVLSLLGAKVFHLTQLGGDNLDLFIRKTREDGLEIVWVHSGSEIRFCYTLINKGNGSFTEIVENGEPVKRGTEDSVKKKYDKLLNNTDTVIISGSRAPGFSSGIIPGMVKTAKALGKLVILDFQGEDLLNSLSFKPDIIKPNLYEFTRTFFPEEIKREEEDPGPLIHKIKDKMLDLYNSAGIITILTNGKKNTFYVSEGTVKEAYPEKTEPVNPIGSGDAFTAGLAWKLAAGSTLDDAVGFAHTCGTRNAVLLKPGTI